MFPDPVLDRLSRTLPPRSRILDLGCGTGAFAHALSGRGYSVHAVDVDGDAVETARSLWGASGDDACYCVARGKSLPFRNDTFDAVVCLDVLHWVPDREAFASIWEEALRVLRGEGLFVARLLYREAFPDARPLGEGRFRLASGAEWFLPDRAGLEARLRVFAPHPSDGFVPDADGRAVVSLRKSAPAAG